MHTDKDVKRYKCLSTKINRKVVDKLLETDVNLKDSYAVYDGKKNLYAPQRLILKFPYERKVTFKDNFEENKNDVFNIIIKPVQKKNADGTKSTDCAISFEPLHELLAGKKFNIVDIQESWMALQTIFRHTPAFKYVPIGRSFFHTDFGAMHPLGGGVEIWYGYHQSCRLGQRKPMINLNTSATTFFSRTSLLTYFSAQLGANTELQYYTGVQENDPILKQLNHDLKNVNIEVTHQSKRKYSIIKVTDKNSSQIEFQVQETGRNISVRDYFRERYGVALKYPHLPCVQVKPLHANRYFPLELCEIIEGQHCRQELSSSKKTEMIKYTAQPPKEKFDKIKTVKDKYANYNNDEYVKRYNMKVANESLSVIGRELEAPNIKYSGDKFQPFNGTWNIINKKFYESCKIDSWCLLSLANSYQCRKDNLDTFIERLLEIGRAAGIKVQCPIKAVYIRQEQLFKELKKLGDDNVQLTVVVIPFKDKQLYRNVKQLAENNIGIITQCIDHKNVVKSNGSVLSNLWQKINTKMGGINHALTVEEIPKIMAKPTIIMGADVSHASVTDTSGISVAAVAGSLDMRALTRFAVTCELQKNENTKKKSVEIIVKLKEMVKKLLVEFNRHTRQKPEKIIFYRDGVSEGQFSQVQNVEIPKIREACNELEKDYRPLITYVVVQKRHHVRFKPDDSRRGAGPEKNIKPGTVVDTEVVHPLHRDFYLCSHLGLKGTSRPAYYTILEDESDFSSDEFQGLTNYLCFNFARCTKSISVPVPVRYAHLAAYRIRILLPQSGNNKKTDKNNEDDSKIPENILQAAQINSKISRRMYFV